MAAAIYSTTAQEGIDVNSVFILSTGTPEYPRPPFLPGELAWGTDGSEWVYVTSSISVSAGSVLVISAVPGSWSVAPIGGAVITGTAIPYGQLVAVSGGSSGTLAVPAPASPQVANFFWAQRAGNAPNVQTTAAFAKNTAAFDNATTAGIIGPSPGTGSGYAVNGIVITQAAGSTAGPNTAVLNYPSVGASS